jgi:hypothetical protein
MRLFLEGMAYQSVGVLDDPHSGDGVNAQVRADDERLVFEIADDADAQAAAHLLDVLFELGSELGIAYIVDVSTETPAFDGGQSAPAGAQMGMVVRAEKEIGDTVLF